MYCTGIDSRKTWETDNICLKLLAMHVNSCGS